MKRLTMNHRVAVVSIVAALLLAAHVTAVHFEIRKLADEWKSFNDTAVAEQGRLRTVRVAAGYGGFIHHFKNYVLRRERFYLIEAGQKLDEMEEALTGLEALLQDEIGQRSVRQLRQVFTEYRNQWHYAGSDEAQALSAVALDQRVRVSDTAAIEAFATLSTQFDLKRRAGFERYEGALREIAVLSAFGLLFVPMVLLLGYWLWRTYHRMSLDQRALDLARAQAVEANLAKSQFFANMSHEIRTPMNAIIGLSGLAMQLEASPKLHGYLDKIHGAGQSLMVVINDLLDFSKIEAERLMLESRDFSLEDVLNRTVKTVGFAAHQKQVELVLNVDPTLPRLLVGDPTRLEQVLLNLVGNAIKFTARGEVRLELKVQHLAPERVRLRFVVADTGIGLTQQQLAILFRPFSQADASATRLHGGTGLGLAICRQLVQLMGGEIGVNSEPGEGSRFWFEVELPVANARLTSEVQTHGLAGQHVLVIDDAESSRTALRDYLLGLDMKVELAASGIEALARFETQFIGGGFDLVLIDLRMPGMDGLETARRVRSLANPAKPQRIIMVSAYDLDDIRPQALEAGVQGFLSKPVSPSQLLDAILECVGHAETAGLAQADDPMLVEARARLAGKRLLLAEDNEVNQFVAQACLEPLGLLIDMVSDGLQAIEKFKAGRYDAVLMDVQMPHVDGLQATASIRRLQGGGALPIIAMTAGVLREERERCLAAGMNTVIGKPVTQQELIRVLMAALG